MIGKQEAKNIAGAMFVSKFDRSFLTKNIEKLCTMESDQGDNLVVDFCVFSDIEDAAVLSDKGLSVKEENFPELLMTVSVNLLNKQTKVLYQKN